MAARPWKLPGALREARLRHEAKRIFIIGEEPPGGGNPKLTVHRQIQALAETDPDLHETILKAAGSLVQAIKRGDFIADRHYRKSDRFDRLLKGPLCVMHLHVINPGDDYLLYLVQFKGAVLLVELGPHVHMEGEPPGRGFNLVRLKKLAARIVEAIPPDPDEAREDEDDYD